MPTPRLIHPVAVLLEQKNVATTIYDDVTKEPIRQAARKTKVTIQAQVLWDYHQDARMQQGGLELGESGYFLVRTIDMTKLGIVLQQGDRVLSMGGVEAGLYVTRLRPMGHYSALGATLLRCYFGDRDPTHASPGA